ncbi:cyclopropane-fatty-acyl-phospholipid synthase family protein [Streptomyces sp. ISL-100]|uniref:SAM-dependent methyltransferase n=1 Tax=Streptomyces sp. ISL-100 TaxID=2819173 RepID=UPI001BE5E547|nr:class I SAM-dependent methyltransferase [Streptomyces sp. ISL-100]MBT2401676.1 methyltransferase domain-containing protein [Streptomyces sp. ISL-100]
MTAPAPRTTAAAVTPPVEGTVNEADAGAFYAAVADFCATAAGTAALHKGYFHGPEDPASLAEGADRLTRLAGDRLGLAPGDRLLDIGCGTGQPALLLAAETGCSVTGVDTSEALVRAARHRAAQTENAEAAAFHQGCVTALPFPADGFDQVLMVEVASHLPHGVLPCAKTRALAEAARVLRPGGRLLLADLVLLSRSGRQDGELTAAPSVHLATPEHHLELLDAAGFDVLHVDDLTERVRPTGHKTLQAIHQRRDRLLKAHGPAIAERMTVLVEQLAAADRHVGYHMITASVRD